MSEDSMPQPATFDAEPSEMEAAESDAPHEPEASPEMVDVSDLEIPIQFGVGNLDVSIKQLESIQSGFIFELDTPAGQPVVIRSAGKAIGRGSLVQIGDKLGVQVTEWN